MQLLWLRFIPNPIRKAVHGQRQTNDSSRLAARLTLDQRDSLGGIGHERLEDLQR